MSLETSEMCESVVVRYYDNTGDYEKQSSVFQHRQFIDEYHSATGTPLNEHVVYSDNENIVNYLS